MYNKNSSFFPTHQNLDEFLPTLTADTYKTAFGNKIVIVAT